jgi:hypothetical protein
VQVQEQTDDYWKRLGVEVGVEQVDLMTLRELVPAEKRRMVEVVMKVHSIVNCVKVVVEKKMRMNVKRAEKQEALNSALMIYRMIDYR